MSLYEFESKGSTDTPIKHAINRRKVSYAAVVPAEENKYTLIFVVDSVKLEINQLNQKEAMIHYYQLLRYLSNGSSCTTRNYGYLKGNTYV